MLARLRDNWVYGGVLAALMLLALTPVLAKGWPLPLLLIWLQLPVYMLHQYEEHDADRFRLFVNETLGGGREMLTRPDTFVINIAGVWGVNTAAFILAASVDVGFGLVAVYLSVVNGFIHCAQAVALRRPNPGLATSILLFIPLGTATLWVLSGVEGVGVWHHLGGLGVSLALHAAIVVHALRRRRRADAIR